MIGTALYNCFLRSAEYRTIFTLSQCIFVFYAILQVLFVTRITKDVLGLDDHLVAVLGSSSEEVLDQALRFMPSVVLFSKITPPSLEGTVYSVFASINNFAFMFLAPTIGASLAAAYGVNRTDFSRLPILYAISVACHLVTIPFIWLVVPKKSEIEEYLNSREEEAKADAMEPLLQNHH